eukprot:GILJ01004240.1.p1 GENE.GILJ01004240.1~~GILJ01004240.1.p1  ORF type:complete len:356 (+),score=32.34 GILJ01004240.1:190-1257(+)
MASRVQQLPSPKFACADIRFALDGQTAFGFTPSTYFHKATSSSNLNLIDLHHMSSEWQIDDKFGQCSTLALHPSVEVLAFASTTPNPQLVHVWNWPDGDMKMPIRTISHSARDPVLATTFSLKGDLLITAGTICRAWYWRTGELFREYVHLPIHAWPSIRVTDKYLVAAGEGKHTIIAVWDLYTAEKVHSFNTDGYRSVSCSFLDNTVFYVNGLHHVSSFRVPTGKPETVYTSPKTTDRITMCAASGDGILALLVVHAPRPCTMKYDLRLFDSHRNRCIGEYELKAKPSHLAFNPDNSLLFVLTPGSPPLVFTITSSLKLWRERRELLLVHRREKDDHVVSRLPEHVLRYILEFL